MRVYQCASEGCGKGLITEFQEWGFCPRCGGTKWRKLRRVTYWKMFRIWWMSGRRLVVPPEGSRLERYLLERLPDEAENVKITEGMVRSQVPQDFMKGGSRG